MQKVRMYFFLELKKIAAIVEIGDFEVEDYFGEASEDY